MSIAPQVELRFDPTGLRPRDIPRAGDFLGSPAEALEAALAVARAQMVTEMRQQMRGIAEPTRAQLLRIADLAWQAAFWRFRKVSAPIMADAYIRAYRMADAGDVPMSLIYDLADKHAEKIGGYFHETSREALLEGYNTYVNRRVPAKAAVDRVLDAYGLTPRQMRAYTAAKQFDTPIADVLPRSLKAKARSYIDRLFTTRTKALSAQEEHNIDEQAKQLAWMWLQDKGRLSPKAQKMWLTAHDERVCPVCGPLHGKKVGINERFVTKEGEFWTPGLHPNCRCVVRLLENRFSKALAGTELKEFNELHPREEHGRFSAKARTKVIDVDEEFARIAAGYRKPQPVRHLTYTPQAEPERDTELATQFQELVSAQPKTRGFSGGFESALDRQAVLEQIRDVEPMMEFATELTVDMRAAVKTDPKLKPGKIPTVPLAKPAFAVIFNENLGPDGLDGPINLKHSTIWSTNEVQASLDASEAIRRKVEHEVLQIVETGEGRYKEHDRATGQDYYAHINAKDARRIANWYANSATAYYHEGDPERGDNYIPLQWEDEVGRPVERTGDNLRKFSEIGTFFELERTEFEVYVVRTDRLPFDENAVANLGSDDHNVERFTVEGTYEAIPRSLNRTQLGPYSATSFKIEPKGSVQLPEG